MSDENAAENPGAPIGIDYGVPHHRRGDMPLEKLSGIFRLFFRKDRNEMKSKIFLILITAAFSTLPVEDNHIRRAELLRVIDGDTVDLKVILGFDVEVEIRARLQGIDAPEIHTKDMMEKKRGIEAKKFLAEKLRDDIIMIKCPKKGKYGRWICTVFTGKNGNINDLMIKERQAVKWRN